MYSITVVLFSAVHSQTNTVGFGQHQSKEKAPIEASMHAQYE